MPSNLPLPSLSDLANFYWTFGEPDADPVSLCDPICRTGDSVLLSKLGLCKILGGWGGQVQLLDKNNRVHTYAGKYVYRESDTAPWMIVDNDFALDAYAQYMDRMQSYRAKIRKAKALAKEREEQRAIELARRKNKIKNQITRVLTTDFPSTDRFYRDNYIDVLDQTEYEELKVAFVRAWFDKRLRAEGCSSQIPLDDDQIAVIADSSKALLVAAKAGSGKTTTIVYKALFNLLHCRLSPGELLMIAFNKKAAAEISERFEHLYCQLCSEAELSKEGTGVDKPNILTFHALAKRVARPSERLTFGAGDQTGNKVESLVVDRRNVDRQFELRLNQFLRAFCSEDIFQLNEEGHLRSDEVNYVKYRRSLRYLTFAGDEIKSQGERRIANFLFEHDIPYEYEKNIYWDGFNYRPDFTITLQNGKNLVIEYFGMFDTGDPDYDSSTLSKREFWTRKPDTNYLELYVSDARLSDSKFEAKLSTFLNNSGCIYRRLPNNELWSRLVANTRLKLTSAFVTYIQLAKSKNLPPPRLASMIKSYRPSSQAESMFLPIANEIYQDYLESLDRNGEIDGDGLIQRGAQAISRGATSFSSPKHHADLRAIQQVYVDEFQDFSTGFYQLLNNALSRSNNASLVCVGDDWQAINGFAGADVKYFQNFKQYFADSKTLGLPRNYRSDGHIVNFGSDVMSEYGTRSNPVHAANNLVTICDLSQFKPTYLENRHFEFDKFTPALVRIVNQLLVNNEHVTLLHRSKKIPWPVNYAAANHRYDLKSKTHFELLKSHIAKDLRDRISISNVNQFKGREDSATILLDAVEGSFPLIHPTSSLTGIFGVTVQDVIAEEQRLFYVAVSRAKRELVIVTEEHRSSPFLLTEPCWGRNSCQIDWESYSSGFISGNTGIHADLPPYISVSSLPRRGSSPTIAIKETLKSTGYRYQADTQCWNKTLDDKTAAVRQFAEEAWVPTADGVRVSVYNGEGTVTSEYQILAGEVSKI